MTAQQQQQPKADENNGSPVVTNGSTPKVNGSSPQINGTTPGIVNGFAATGPPPPGSSSTPRAGPKFTLPAISLVDSYADEPRKLRVTVIGAGIAGIITGILLPAKVPGIELTVLEKNADVGGVWFENVYPGVRCDVPAHVYQTSFAPNTQWSEEYAQGPEIRAYWARLAREHGLHRHLRLSHEVRGLEWDARRSVWLVRVCDLRRAEADTTAAAEDDDDDDDDGRDGHTFVHEADFVISAIGRFNDWRMPDYPGIRDFRGHIRHTSNWDPAFDPTGKRVAVIGNGASGIQIVPHLQPRVAHLDHYARSRTWIAESWGGVSDRIERKPIPPALRESFRDPAVYTAYRKKLEDPHWRWFQGWIRGSDSNTGARAALVKHLEDRLSKCNIGNDDDDDDDNNDGGSRDGRDGSSSSSRLSDLVASLTPDFAPHCRRLTPGPGYLEAITAPNVTYIQDPIVRFTETGIETADGTHRAVDAVLAATGANTDVLPPFDVVGADGRSLTALWSPDGGADGYGFPYTYLGFAVPGFPNLGFVQGPSGAGRSGTVPHNCEVQATYFARVLRKMGLEGIRSMQPSRRAADDFVQYSDAFFRRTVMAECRSWYNSGDRDGRVHGLWPGSAALVSIVAGAPRWEDWEYEYVDRSGNSLVGFFGNGCTRREMDPEHDMTPYLVDPETIDLKKLHEGWWEIP